MKKQKLRKIRKNKYMKARSTKEVLKPIKHGVKTGKLANVPKSNTMPQPKNPYTRETGYGLKNKNC
jgi:hypothetical protein